MERRERSGRVSVMMTTEGVKRREERRGRREKREKREKRESLPAVLWRLRHSMGLGYARRYEYMNRERKERVGDVSMSMVML